MAKVIRAFTDKETRQFYAVSSDYTGSKERIKELTDKGYLSAEESPAKKKNKKDEV